MKLFEVILEAQLESIPYEHQYNTFLTIQVEGNVESDEDAIKKAFDYAENALGIAATNLQFVSVDELQ